MTAAQTESKPVPITLETIDWSLPPQLIYAMLQEQARQVYRAWQADVARRLAETAPAASPAPAAEVAKPAPKLIVDPAVHEEPAPAPSAKTATKPARARKKAAA